MKQSENSGFKEIIISFVATVAAIAVFSILVIGDSSHSHPYKPCECYQYAKVGTIYQVCPETLQALVEADLLSKDLNKSEVRHLVEMINKYEDPYLVLENFIGNISSTNQINSLLIRSQLLERDHYSFTYIGALKKSINPKGHYRS